MTQTETRYAQIEKELLAVMFACYRFYDYVYGKPVTIETDHQPLVTTHNKPFHRVPARLQGMMLQLLKFNLIFTYKKGKHLYLADTPCTAVQRQRTRGRIRQVEVMTLQMISPRRLEKLREHPASKRVLQNITSCIQNGWPRPIRPFFNFCDELLVKKEIVMRGDSCCSCCP
ncbi:hypothetical protein ACEWY4_007670 [Coilia grayii]|uniref:Reverse transcriptase RNase H-like domain-containing protein n=1 Tax=Coilia grayii TaxID=363190 RepID=A0ABD1K8T6_9TELE